MQEYQPGCGLEFHFDKDEHALKQSKAWRQPLLSSVLYLCGDQQAAPLGAPSQHVSPPVSAQPLPAELLAGLYCLLASLQESFARDLQVPLLCLHMVDVTQLEAKPYSLL